MFFLGDGEALNASEQRKGTVKTFQLTALYTITIAE